MKSRSTSFVLTLCFGPVGLLYASVPIGIIVCFITVITYEYTAAIAICWILSMFIGDHLIGKKQKIAPFIKSKQINGVQTYHMKVPAREFMEVLEEWDTDNYLGDAAIAEEKALQAIREGKHDEAWRLLHEQKMYYMQHANRYGHSPANAIALEASVGEHLANILRIEKKHSQAFEHILLWVASSSQYRTKKQNQKLVAYFNRLKLKNTSIDDVETFISAVKIPPNPMRRIQLIVKEWIDLG